MKAILSPAMNMGDNINDNIEKTVPVFKEKASKISKSLKKLDPFKLESELGITPKLMEKAFRYYENFDCENIEEKGSQAIISFQGLAYKNINCDDFTKEDFDFANKNLRILSALYGVLKPLDLIQKYRLDFMCNFAKKSIDGKKLYEFWGDDVYKEVFKENEVVVGICSREYEKLIKPYLNSEDKYIYCDFLINKNGKFKAYATASKIARGQMARYIVKNKVEDIEMLKDFCYDGFQYSQYYSNEKTMTFMKNQL